MTNYTDTNAIATALQDIQKSLLSINDRITAQDRALQALYMAIDDMQDAQASTALNVQNVVDMQKNTRDTLRKHTALLQGIDYAVTDTPVIEDL